MQLFSINECPNFFWRLNVRVVAKPFKKDGLRIVRKHVRESDHGIRAAGCQAKWRVRSRYHTRDAGARDAVRPRVGRQPIAATALLHATARLRCIGCDMPDQT